MNGEPLNGGLMRFQPSAGAVGPDFSPFAHLGQEAGVAYNSAAPADEVEDATTRLSRMYAPAMGAADPGLMNMVEQFVAMQHSERHAEDMVAKAMRIRDGEPEPTGKAQTMSWSSEFGRGFFKWLPKKGVQLPILRAFGRRLEVHQAILRTRKRQVDRFSRQSRAIDQLGWRLVMRDEEGEAGEDVRSMMKWLSRVLECGGREFDPVMRRELKRQGMTQFLRYMIHDGLELDQAAVELVGLNGAEGLDSWYVRPSETFALSNPQTDEKMPNGRPVYAYQVLNGRAEIPFGFDELALFSRNTSTWAEENGYGYSEFEQCLDTINNILQSITYTKQGLNENSVPRGILMAFGNYDHRTQQAFQSAWQAKVRGVQNQHGLPILFSRGQQGAVQYLNTGQPFDEMAFAKWISFNFTIAGAIYGVSPEEVGMEGFTADSKSTLSGDDTAEKLAASKDKGLHPLLKDCATFISDEILHRFSHRVKLEFTGLDAQNTKERWAEKIKHMTINEVRATFDMPPHPLGWFGDLPADTGEQAAEFQRMNAVLTVGEGRKVWGQLPGLPSDMVNEMPLNPSLNAVYMQALMVPPEVEEDDAANGRPPIDQQGQGGDPSQDLAGQIHGRLAELANDSAPFNSLDDMKAQAGVEEPASA